METKPTPSAKTPPAKKLTTEKRREIIKKRIEQNGLWNVNKTRLAEELKVNRDTIKEDFKVLIANIDEIDLKEAEVHIGKKYQEVFDTMHSMAESSELSAKERQGAAKAMATLGDSLTKHLEAYGAKKPVVQFIEHSGEIKTQLFAFDPSAFKQTKESQ